MQVILLQDVPKIGRRYEVKDVSDGYAANFLLPRKLAERATAQGITRVKKHQARIASERELELDLLEKNLAALSTVKLGLSVPANEHGHLYEGIHAEGIIKALKEQAHIDLNADFIKLNHPLKSVGEHRVEIGAHGHQGYVTVEISAAAS